MRTRLKIFCLAAFLCVFADMPANAASSSENFVLEKGEVTGGGGSSSSDTFSTTTVLGQTFPSGSMESPEFKMDFGLMMDTVPPVLTCPADLSVLLNTPASDPAVAGFLSGAVATDDIDASVPVAHSAVPDVLSPVGTTTVSFTATDAAGNSSSCSAGIKVVYAFGGFLPPIDQDRPFKLGNTIPVKFRLMEAHGDMTSTASAAISLQKYSETGPVDDPLDGTEAGADNGNMFRYDEDDGQYVFNLGTRGLTQGSWQVSVSLDDGTTHAVVIFIK
ncbi:MAG: HYR domain-containing protein [Candidatus Methylomirabilis sp.]|nr:HYR domain-containing protein [Deltaproteobacteria bacterium]